MFCVLWSILAKMFPATINQNFTSSYKQHFKKLDITGIDFTNGLRVEFIPKLQSKNALNLNLFELNVKFKDHLGVTSKLFPIYILDSDSEPIEFFRYEYHFFYNKKLLHVVICNPNKTHVCRNYLNFFMMSIDY